MRVEDVVNLVNYGIIVMPGWQLEANDYTARHEHAVCLTITYETFDYRQSEAPDYSTPINPHAKFIIDAELMVNMDDVVREVIKACVKVCEHEIREAMRIGPTWHGPFNPHTTRGREQWGDPTGDLAFGIV